MMQNVTQQTVLIQWKEVLALIIALCGAVSAVCGMIYGTYRVARSALHAGFNVHAKPLVERLMKEINGVSGAVNAVKSEHERVHAETRATLERQASDINDVATRADAHDDELRDHETRIAVLESKVEAAV